MNNWISVKDRLPENEQTVLICVKRRWYDNPKRFIRLIAKAFYTDGYHHSADSGYVWNCSDNEFVYDEKEEDYIIPKGWWESVDYAESFSMVDDFVTHWMPLPEPPKEENPCSKTE